MWRNRNAIHLDLLPSLLSNLMRRRVLTFPSPGRLWSASSVSTVVFKGTVSYVWSLGGWGVIYVIFGDPLEWKSSIFHSAVQTLVQGLRGRQLPSKTGFNRGGSTGRGMGYSFFFSGLIVFWLLRDFIRFYQSFFHYYLLLLLEYHHIISSIVMSEIPVLRTESRRWLLTWYPFTG